MIHLFFALCALTLFAACSKVEDMHSATMEMNDTTAQLSGTSTKMNEMMAEVYDSGRQGASLDLRGKLFDSVVNSPKIEEKATNAGLYFLAFEFQLWSNLGQDNETAERERLMKDAVDEFFCHLLSLTHWTEVDPFAGKTPLGFGETENERASFNAFAATLERNNRKQEINTRNYGLESISMLNMIENALLADQEIKAGRARLEDFPEYVDIVRQHEGLAVRLLEARYQMLGIFVLSQLTPIAKSYWDGFLYKIWGTSWSLDPAKLNSSELRLATFRLREATRARDFLAGIGVEVKLNSSVQSIYGNASLETAVARTAEAGAHRAAQDEFMGALANYLGEAN